MARIRSIKPEFPQSESLGRVSREARLLFIGLWTICDDEGRTRAASRLLASLLYPYDADAPSLINGWLDELSGIGAIRRYVVNGSTYLDIPNWLKHQKIDKPGKSRLPAFDEDSRTFANIREESTTDLGPRTLDLGKDLGVDAATDVASEDAPAWRQRIQQGKSLTHGEAGHKRNCAPWAYAACEAGLCVPKYLWPQWEKRQPLEALRAFVLEWAPRAKGDKAEKFWPAAFEAHFGIGAPAQHQGRAERVMSAAERVIAKQLDTRKALVGHGD